MDENRKAIILNRLREGSTTESLLKELNENPPEHWSEEGLEAVKQLLRERNLEFKGIPDIKQFDVRFRTKISKIEGESRYLGNGKILLSQAGVKILGKISYSKGEQIIFGALIVIFSLILANALGLNKIYVPSIWVIWFVVGAVLRKENDIMVPWNDITSVEYDREKELVGIDFRGYPNCHPVVFISDNIDMLISELNSGKNGR